MGRATKIMNGALRMARERREHEETLALYESFLSVIASCVRARLVARAMDGRTMLAGVGDAVFEAVLVYEGHRYLRRWEIARWREGRSEIVAVIKGTPEDTAAEVVDTVLRLAAEWSER
jgi:hypothetical protein